MKKLSKSKRSGVLRRLAEGSISSTQKGFFRLSRHALINTLIILIALITLTFCVSKWLISLWFFFFKEAEAAPWSTTHGSWQKRKQLTLTNNSGSTLNANVPYQITVDTKTNTSKGTI